MTPRERLMLNRLVTRLVEAPDMPKDPDAELECAALLRTRPDAPYLLIQRCLLLEVALEQAQAELARVREQDGTARGPAASAGSASHVVPADDASWASRGGFGARAGARPVTGTGPSAPSPLGGAPSAGGGFLRQAAAVGAGVLGGSLLFQGLGSLMGGFGHGSGESGQGLLGGDAADALGAGSSGEGFSEIDPIPPVSPDAGFLQEDAGLADGDAGFDDGAFDDGGDDWA